MAKLKPDYIEWVLKLNSTQAQDEYHKLEKANRELKKENDATRKSMVELEKQGKKGSQEWKNLKSAIDSNNRTMADNRKKMEAISKQFDKSTMTVNQLRKQLKELTREFNNTSKASDPKRYKDLQLQIQKTKEALNQATGAVKGFSGSLGAMTKMKSAIQGFFAGIGSAIFTNVTGAFRNAFKDLQDFELENTKLAAQLGTTKKGIKDLTDAALKWEAATTYSATGVTQLQRELIKLGYSKDQVLDMTESVIMFAKISGSELPEAASMAASTLKIFGKEADDTKEMMSILSAAVTTAGLDFGTLQSALSNLGPVASQTGFSLGDTVAILGMLQKAGLDAASASTATRNMLLKMANSSGELAKTLGRPVKSAEDLVAGMKSLKDAGVDLEGALELTDKRTAALLETFINSGSSITELKTAIDGAKNSFEETYQMMDNNVKGALANLSSAADSLVKQIAMGTDGPLKAFIDVLTMMVNGLKSVVIWIQEHSRWVKTILTGLAAWKVSQSALNGVQKAWNALVKISGAEIANLTAKEKAAAVAKGLYTNATNAATAATKSLSAAMKAMPWGAIIGLVSSAISYFTIFRKSTDDVSNSTDHLAEVQRKAEEAAANAEAALENERQTYAQQVVQLELNIEKLRNFNGTKEEEQAIVEDLNNTYGDTLGYFDSVRGWYNILISSSQEYCKQLENEMYARYYANQAEEAFKEYMDIVFDEKGNHRKYDATKPKSYKYEEREYMDEDGKRHKESGIFYTEDPSPYDIAVQKRDDAYARYKNALKKSKEYGSKGRKKTAPKPPSGRVSHGSHGGGKKSGGSHRSSSHSTGSNKNSGNTEKKDPIAEATKDAEAKHQNKLNEIEKEEFDLSDEDYQIKKAEELIRYCGDLTKALEELKGKTKESEKELLGQIASKESDIADDIADAREAINAARDSIATKELGNELERLNLFYEGQQDMVQKAMNEQIITQEAGEIYLMDWQKKIHEAQLEELKEYYQKVKEADYLGEADKKERLKEIRNDMAEMQRQILIDTGNFMSKYRELTENTEGKAGLKATYDRQVKEITQQYDMMISKVEAGSEMEVSLKEAKMRKLLLLDYQYQQQLYEIQENVGLGWSDEYNLELLRLKEMHAQGILNEKEYQRKRLELGVNSAKQYFDYYSGLSGSMFQAIQDAEIAMSDAKYDVLIRQAKNNGEETAELEQEKENKKLEIQKRYADVDFAIKASQIVADTAVAIMKVYSQLGIPGGIIAAALMSATGIAQLLAANAEREKVKKLQPSTNPSSSSVSETSASATRVLSGFSEGGYTGDGDRYEVAGLVHKGEYVVPKPIMNNPLVVDAVGTIEAIRLNRRGKIEGYADGGYASGNSNVGNGLFGNQSIGDALISELQSVCNEMKGALRNIRAYVVLQDLEKKQKQLNDARAPFRR